MHLLYELGWCIDWLQFIKALRCQTGNVCQVKMCKIYTMYTIYTMTFQFRDRKSWYEQERKMNCGEKITPYSFIVSSSMRKPVWETCATQSCTGISVVKTWSLLIQEKRWNFKAYYIKWAFLSSPASFTLARADINVKRVTNYLDPSVMSRIHPGISLV